MIHKNLTLSSSNKQKVNEYTNMGLSDISVTKGQDLKEVKADADTVAIYKALAAGNKVIVDDTILEVDGEEVVDIRWKLKDVSKMEKAKILWHVTLAIKDEDHIYLYKGTTECVLVKSDMDPNGYHAFDPFLKPIDVNKSFYELDMEGKKGDYSPRSKAIKNLIDGNFMKKIPIKDIKEWSGDYQ